MKPYLEKFMQCDMCMCRLLQCIGIHVMYLNIRHLYVLIAAMSEYVILVVTPFYLQTSKEDLVMPSGVSTDVIEPEKGY